MNDSLANAAALLAGMSLPVSAIGLRPSLPRLLSSIRKHLDMDVAFIAEIADGRRWFRHVDAGDVEEPIHQGGSDLAKESDCLRVIDGLRSDGMHMVFQPITDVLTNRVVAF